jgi:hypothetical protein
MHHVYVVPVKIVAYMKNTIAILILVLAVLVSGCTSASSPASPATPVTQSSEPPAVIPDLTGTWTGPMKGYDEYAGFTDYTNFTVEIHITEQRDRIFTGTIVFAPKGGKVTTTGIAGAISADGKTFSIVEKEWGYSTGRIIARDEIEITYLNDHTPYSAAIDSFKRV